MRSLSDDDLLRRLTEVVRQSRRVEAELVALIAEVDARRLYAREAMPSMFAFCTEVLHLSEPEAILRIRVARASRQHPMLLTELREGRLHLSGIALLAPLLTRRNRESLLRRAVHKSKEQIRELVAELAPRPDVASTMRRLPNRRSAGPCPPVPPPSPGAPAFPEALVAPARPTTTPLCPDTVDVGNLLLGGEIVGAPASASDLLAPRAALARSPEPVVDSALASPALASVTPVPAAPRSPALVSAAHTKPATVEPLAPLRYKVQFTASAELREKLQRLQALMRSSVPDGDLAGIIDAAVTEKLERLEARRFGKTASPRKTVADAETTPASRHIPAPIRRAVHDRDGGRCTYEDATGRRCPARQGLEFHHHGRPFGYGGEHSVANVRLTCRQHNRLLAERDYGREKMARFTRRADRLGEAEDGVGAGPGAPGGP